MAFYSTYVGHVPCHLNYVTFHVTFHLQWGYMHSKIVEYGNGRNGGGEGWGGRGYTVRIHRHLRNDKNTFTSIKAQGQTTLTYTPWYTHHDTHTRLWDITMLQCRHSTLETGNSAPTSLFTPTSLKIIIHKWTIIMVPVYLLKYFNFPALTPLPIFPTSTHVKLSLACTMRFHYAYCLLSTCGSLAILSVWTQPSHVKWSNSK